MSTGDKEVVNNYESVSEASAKTGLTPQYIRFLARIGRIEGVVRFGSLWMLPKSWAIDRRTQPDG